MRTFGGALKMLFVVVIALVYRAIKTQHVAHVLFSLYLNEIVKRERDEREEKKGRGKEEGWVEKEREELKRT